MEGRVRKLMERGFGFIGLPDGGDLFFHCSAVEGVDFESLKEGDLMGYEMEKEPKGNRAVKVQRLREEKAEEKEQKEAKA